MKKQMDENHFKTLRGMFFSGLALALVLTASPFTAASPQAEKAFQSACKLYNAGKYEAAKDAFIDLLSAEPNFWPARYQLANAYMQSGQMLEASIEYEKVLEDTKDAKTRQNCLKALSYIEERTGGTPSGEARNPLTEKVDQTSASLTIEGRRRLAEKESQIERERNEIVRKARVKASYIKNQAKEQAAAAVANSNWYILDQSYNLKPSLIPPGREQAGIEAANELAETIKEAARAQAESMRAPCEDDVTENLKSQLKVNAVNAKFRMNPVGTNVYVRNYKSTSNKSNAAVKSDSMKGKD